MFFGLNKFLKIVLPKGLFYRSLIIVAAPTIILQLIITIVFFDSIWIKANKGMTRSLVGEIKTLVDVYQLGNKENTFKIVNTYKKLKWKSSVKLNEGIADTISWYLSNQ